MPLRLGSVNNTYAEPKHQFFKEHIELKFYIILQVFYILCATFGSCCTKLTPSRGKITGVFGHLNRLYDIL